MFDSIPHHLSNVKIKQQSIMFHHAGIRGEIDSTCDANIYKNWHQFHSKHVFDLEFTVPLSIGVITTTEFNTSKNYDTFIDQSQTGSQNCLILRKLLIYFFSFSLFADKIRNLKWWYMSIENGRFFFLKKRYLIVCIKCLIKNRFILQRLFSSLELCWNLIH